jgi:hypothetical protein
MKFSLFIFRQILFNLHQQDGQDQHKEYVGIGPRGPQADCLPSTSASAFLSLNNGEEALPIKELAQQAQIWHGSQRHVQ